MSRDDPDATMAVMPADHVIRPAEKFQAAIRQAAALVDESPGRIVTFGIKPTYPAEIFGYIQRGEASGDQVGIAAAYTCQAIQGKARRRHGQEVSSTRANTIGTRGIFVWRAATILDALRQRQPEMLEHLEAIVAAWDTQGSRRRVSSASSRRSSRFRSTMPSWSTPPTWP